MRPPACIPPHPPAPVPYLAPPSPSHLAPSTCIHLPLTPFHATLALMIPQSRTSPPLPFYHLPTWAGLRRLGSSRAVRSSYVWFALVPLAARLLAPLAAGHDVTLFGATFTLEVALPFTWQVLFFSATAFALAQLLYSLRCPPIVRHYAHFADYKAAHSPSTFLLSEPLEALVRQLRSFDRGPAGSAAKHHALHLIHTLSSSARADHPQMLDAFDKPGPTPTSPVIADFHDFALNHLLSPDIDPARLAQAFSILRSHDSLLFPAARRACHLLFLLGFALLIPVIGENFWAVFKLLF